MPFLSRLPCVAAALVLVAGLLSACSTPSEKPMKTDVSESTTMEKGVPGGVHTRTERLEATVRTINYDARTVTLADDDGNMKTITVGPDAVNFNQVEVGDRVTVVYIEETVVYLKAIGETSTDGAAGMAAAAPEGQKPRGFAGGTAQVTAVVKSVNLEHHTATLEFPNGDVRQVPVRDDVKLSNDQVGREVVIQITAAVALSVDKAE
ncbi:hypothetical protein [Marinobacter sp. R17]|uniref:hypothetical protein n=1 Tax=Marinobacter sp. R17 TaxID=2484250 RepID=UPI000F4D190A|nr:hypothetical protein [Marinobacter sp. R17]